MKTLYILSALAVIAMLAEIFGSASSLPRQVGGQSRGGFKKFLFPVVLVGLLGAIAAAVKDWNTNIHYYSNMLTFNNYAILFTVVICSTAFLWFLMSQNFFSEEYSKIDHYALVLFALCGAMLMVSYSNMVMLFLGIEILSIPMYVLSGSKKNALSSNEAALKYFLMGAFATGFLLFGIALVYGATGTFDIHILGTYLSSPEPISAWKGVGGETLLYAGILMMMIGMCFKISAVPFHFWAPDVYTGAPTPVTAFMATIVKTAAFAAFLRLFITCFSGMGNVWMNVVWILASLTILLGNITAVYQTSVKRMLAYSSISHAGYMLLAILAMNEYSAGSVLYYAAAYSVSTIGAFAVLNILEGRGMTTNDAKQMTSVTINSLSGLAKQNKLLAFAMTIAMLSLSGIPPLAGFFGKYYIFSSAMQSGYVWLVLIAVLGSLIGVYYYFRMIIRMYSPAVMPPSGGSEEGGYKFSISQLQKILLIFTIVLALLLGIFPDVIIRLL